jgi:hypothetical protein
VLRACLAMALVFSNDDAGDLISYLQRPAIAVLLFALIEPLIKSRIVGSQACENRMV